MSISINGLSTVPPGFRFHPTEEELLAYYLRKKVASENIDLNVIHEIDLNKLEPWDIQEKCRIGSTAENDWYFFSHKDKKYPTGTRTNRATAAGFWKATGRDKVIYACCFKRIGMRKTLVFYKGRAPHGEKSDWIMHEYRLDELHGSDSESNARSTVTEDQFAQEDEWVICRVFKKKSPSKLTVDQTTSPTFTGDTVHPHISHSSRQSSLDQLRTTKSSIHSHSGGQHPRRPRPIDTLLRTTHPVQRTESEQSVYSSSSTGLGDWAVLDRLVAYDMDGSPFFPTTSGGGGGDEGDLWSLTRSAFSHVSHDE